MLPLLICPAAPGKRLGERQTQLADQAVIFGDPDGWERDVLCWKSTHCSEVPGPHSILPSPSSHTVCL